MTDEKQNSLRDLMSFFGTDTKEFTEFWKSLSESEQKYYKNADLS